MINVILNVYNVKSIDYVLKYLNFWLGVFSDHTKYNITILNNYVQLIDYYNVNYKVTNYAEIVNKYQFCKKLYMQIQNNSVANAEFVFSSIAGLYLSDSEYTYNINCNSIILGDSNKYLNKLESNIINSELGCLYYINKKNNLNFSLVNTNFMKEQIICSINKADSKSNIDDINNYLLNSDKCKKFCIDTTYISEENVIKPGKNIINFNKEKITYTKQDLLIIK